MGLILLVFIGIVLVFEAIGKLGARNKMSNSIQSELLRRKSHLSVICTGCGPYLQKLLWIPGSSRYLAGFNTPYSCSEIDRILGFVPESYCSEKTAYDLAVSAYISGVTGIITGGLDREAIGVGVTAAVATDRELRGGYRAYIAVIRKGCFRVVKVRLEAGVGEGVRERHDRRIGNAVLREIGLGLRGLNSYGGVCLLPHHMVFHPEGLRSTRGSSNLYLPGSFNPLHDGHRMMIRAGEEATGRRASYLVSVNTPHKGGLGISEILDKVGVVRADNWKGMGRDIEFCREPLFIDKARARPGSTFIIGADTMMRMLDPMWGVGINDMLAEMKELGVSFLVQPRVIEGKFVEDIPVPGYRELFRWIPGRLDISSTEIRGRQGRGMW